MDSVGVDAAVVAGFGWTDPALARVANDELLEQAQRASERLIPFCSVNPGWGDAAAVEAERCARLGARGIGELHPDTQGFDLGDEATMAPLMEVARRHGLVVLTHASEPVGHQYTGKGRTTPEVLYRFIERFQDVTIICAHFGGGLPFYALMPEVARTLSNVYFDSAAAPFLYTPAVFRTVAGLVGANRVLMGSDFPLLDPQRLLAQVRESGLSADEQELVLGGNAARLFGLSDPGHKG
jgi:predicted TIM-barrel fold metal-dependent hydrolase